MNLVKELNKVAARNAQAEIDESNKILDSVKAHLSEEAKADDDMLKHFGTADVVYSQSQNKTKAHSRLKGALLTRKDIKDICIKYALRCISANQYVKEIPAKTLNDLRLFSENRPTFNSDNLYVIAPVSHFKLGPRPQKDPVLIYNGGEGYVVISQWGSDFNFTRRAYGFFNGKFMQVIYAALFAIGFFACFMTAYTDVSDEGKVGFLSVLFAVFGIIGLLVLLIHSLVEEDLSTHHSRWNRSTK